MRRMVEGRRAARGLADLALRSAVLILTVAPWALAGVDGDGPELSPPSEMPKTAKPPAPARPKPSSPSPGHRRAVLALPGITTPSSRPPAVITSTPSTSTPTVETPAGPGELSLDGPIEMPGVPQVARPRPGPAAGRATRALPSGPLPMEESPGLADPEARPDPSARRPSVSTSRPGPLVIPPGRRGRFFGPILGPSTSRSTTPGRAVVGDSSEDPAVDSALKKRIEKQAREAVGDRARLLEVRVAGKDVSITARGVRFYQKRGVRKALESVPALSGLRSSIEVGD